MCLCELEGREEEKKIFLPPLKIASFFFVLALLFHVSISAAARLLSFSLVNTKKGGGEGRGEGACADSTVQVGQDRKSW